MKNQKWLLLVIALVLMAGSTGALTWLRANQKLGKPGVKAVAIPGSMLMQISLPERVLDFNSTNVPEPQIVVDYLPPDTSYAERCYFNTNGTPIYATVVLMGADRSSIHKPDYCLPGQGWIIREKSVANIPVAGPQPYQMPVAKWVLGNSFQTPDGQKQEVRGLYVFWLVADGVQTADNYQRMWWQGRDLLLTGILQRWAYVSYFTFCLPGEEDATFERVKALIAHSVPEYQWPPPGR